MVQGPKCAKKYTFNVCSCTVLVCENRVLPTLPNRFFATNICAIGVAGGQATLYYLMPSLFMAYLCRLHPAVALGCIFDCAVGAWLGHDGFRWPGAGVARPIQAGGRGRSGLGPVGTDSTSARLDRSGTGGSPLEGRRSVPKRLVGRVFGWSWWGVPMVRWLCSIGVFLTRETPEPRPPWKQKHRRRLNP